MKGFSFFAGFGSVTGVGFSSTLGSGLGGLAGTGAAVLALRFRLRVALGCLVAAFLGLGDGTALAGSSEAVGVAGGVSVGLGAEVWASLGLCCAARF